MGEFFPDEKQQAKKQEQQLITEFYGMCAAYDTLKNKITLISNEAYDAMTPIRIELLGDGRNLQALGQIGEIRNRIRQTRIFKMDLGMMMWNSLRNIEDLSRWTERYTIYMEECLEASDLIIRSAFKFIQDQQSTVNELNHRTKIAEERLLMATSGIPVSNTKELIEAKMQELPKPVKVDTEFVSLLRKKLSLYEEVAKTGDKAKMTIAKMHVFGLCHGDKTKREVAEYEFNRLLKKLSEKNV